MFEVYCGPKKLDMEVFNFHGGEVHFKFKGFIAVPNLTLSVHTDLGTSDEIMLLVLFATYCQDHDMRYTLNLRYVPYARQDRYTSHSEPFSLKAFTKLLNTLNPLWVDIYDAHSDVTPALINHVRNVSRRYIVENNLIARNWLKNDDAVVVAPDAGALKKNFEVAQRFGLPLVVASKHRNVLTGEIDRTTIDTQNIDINGKSLVILDDICDGGKTFIELAKAIRKDYTPKEIKLFVTVGIFSKGVDVVANEFDGIAWHYLKQ